MVGGCMRTVSGYASSNRLDCSRYAWDVGRYGMVVVCMCALVEVDWYIGCPKSPELSWIFVKIRLVLMVDR